jgi:hypothetical protein
MTLPSDHEFPKFHSDRLSFKLYACEQHLKNLKYMESRYGELSSATAKTSLEIEIDSFLFQMIGTVDSLLFKINDRFRLGIPIDAIEIDKVQSGLSSQTKKIDLLADLDAASQYGNWYWMIKQLRNYSLHESLISDQALDLLPDFKVDIKLIAYFEESLNYLTRLIENIKLKEALLQ